MKSGKYPRPQTSTLILWPLSWCQGHNFSETKTERRRKIIKHISYKHSCLVISGWESCKQPYVYAYWDTFQSQIYILNMLKHLKRLRRIKPHLPQAKLMSHSWNPFTEALTLWFIQLQIQIIICWGRGFIKEGLEKEEKSMTPGCTLSGNEFDNGWAPFVRVSILHVS